MAIPTGQAGKPMNRMPSDISPAATTPANTLIPPARRLVSDDIASTARLTLFDIMSAQSIAALALLQVHRGDPNTDAIAYASKDGCFYGPRFVAMNRHQQAFVVGHETLHRVLGHIEAGAILYKREGSTFMGQVFNIACDAVINETCARIEKRNNEIIPRGVEECEEFGIVRWNKLCSEITDYCKANNVDLNPMFENHDVSKFTSTEIYVNLKVIVAACAQKQRDNEAKGKSAGQSSQSGADGSDEAGNSDGAGGENGTAEENIVEKLARSLNAHDDLIDAIKEASSMSESQLRGAMRDHANRLAKTQAGAGKGDVIHEISPVMHQKTPWEAIVRRYLATALINQPNIDPSKPSRRMIANIALAKMTNTRKMIQFEPKTRYTMPAKRLVIIIDTSGTIFFTPDLLNRFMSETVAIVRRTQSNCDIIFADDGVQEHLPIGEAMRKLKTMKPKGGGGTSFVEAIALAEKQNPDCIIYITDLMGEFPTRKPRAPLMWAVPEAYADIKYPFGKRVLLHNC